MRFCFEKGVFQAILVKIVKNITFILSMQNHFSIDFFCQWRIQDFSEGMPTLKVGELTYANFFCRKLHDNERPRGGEGGGPLRRLGSANACYESTFM